MLKLAGKKFGRLTVIEETMERQGASIIWRCVCECGNLDAHVSARDLIAGRRGCGACGDTSHPLYATWIGMIQRCKPDGHKDYGRRGIRVCEEWKNNFLKFLEDMGERPPFHSLDRIDVNGNYCKENCRWATADVQANNKRAITRGLTDAQIIEIYSSKNSAENLSDQFGVSVKTIKNIKCMQYSKKASDICYKYLLGKN